MAKRNRSSQVKRDREQKKRERQRKKAEKAAMKRERRFARNDSDRAEPPDQNIEITDLTTEAITGSQEQRL